MLLLYTIPYHGWLAGLVLPIALWHYVWIETTPYAIAWTVHVHSSLRRRPLQPQVSKHSVRVTPWVESSSSSSSFLLPHVYIHSSEYGADDVMNTTTTTTTTLHSDITVESASVSVPIMATQAPRRRRYGVIPPVRPIRRTTSGTPSLQGSKHQERKEQMEKSQERYIEALKDPTLFVSSTNTSMNSNNNKNSFHTIQPEISSATQRAIQEVVWLQHQMTEIQYRTYPVARCGTSVLGRARTGTGKTIAFLLPAIERLLQMDPRTFRPGRTIGIIVIAPTRELVIQLSQQATKLLTFHHGYTVQPLYGGISIQRDRAILLHRPIPTILISTPGRLWDLLRDSSSFRVQGNRNFIDVIHECPIVIFDEADRLMEGFLTEIKSISSYLPRLEKRQTMLFSATMSSKLKQVLQTGHPKILPPDYATIDCINENDMTTQTNQRVTQSYVQLTDMKLYVFGLLSIVERVMKSNDEDKCSYTKPRKSKVIIFLPTAKLVKFFTEVFKYWSSLPSTQQQKQQVPVYDIYSIHSRMSQGSRNRASTEFRTTRNNHCILLSSDVSARGVDYPDVTLVVQYGAPYSEELYLHRLGRTGRAGQVGNGLLVLLPFETRLLSKYRKYNIVENTAEYNPNPEANPDLEIVIEAIQSAVRGRHAVLAPSAELACTSFIAHYLEYSRSNTKGSTVTNILIAAEHLAQSFGLSSLPELPNNIQSKIKTKKEL